MSESNTEETVSERFDGVPNEIQGADRWICWKEEVRNGYLVPITLDSTGEEAVATNQDTWTTFNASKTAVGLGDADGIGFVLSESDPYTAVRLEDYRAYDGLRESTREVIDQVDSYSEFTPSGDGVQILVQGEIPNEITTNQRTWITESDSYILITGNQVERTPHTIRDYSEDSVDPSEASEGESDEMNSVQDFMDESDGPTDLDLADVRETVLDKFDARTWDVTEAVLSAHATLLIENLQCFGLMIVGASGAGKSTALQLFEGHQEVYRSDDVTPASFVSHDASRDEEELEKIDLLPRIRYKTLMATEMGNWFSGSHEEISKNMSALANVMDGDGYSRDTGSHGRRKYEGDYRFNFIGASTPLSPRAWDQMGHTGNRFVFHEKRTSNSREDVREDLFEGQEYTEKVDTCHELIVDLIDNLWEEHGGYAGVDWPSRPDEEVQDLPVYLGDIVRHGRAPLSEESDRPQFEGRHRVATSLRDLARGHALISGRQQIQLEDLQVCARVALSTMPRKRRRVIQALVKPDNGGELTTGDVVDISGCSRPTAIDRMEEIDTLGIGTCEDIEGDDRGSKILKVKDEFEWPAELEFPEF